MQRNNHAAEMSKLPTAGCGLHRKCFRFGRFSRHFSTTRVSYSERQRLISTGISRHVFPRKSRNSFRKVQAPPGLTTSETRRQRCRSKDRFLACAGQTLNHVHVTAWARQREPWRIDAGLENGRSLTASCRGRRRRCLGELSHVASAITLRGQQVAITGALGQPSGDVRL